MGLGSDPDSKRSLISKKIRKIKIKSRCKNIQLCEFMDTLKSHKFKLSFIMDVINLLNVTRWKINTHIIFSPHVKIMNVKLCEHLGIKNDNEGTIEIEIEIIC